MERCPRCNNYTLNYDPRLGTATCTRFDCRYSEVVVNSDEYFNKFVISSSNWDNYCSQTPLFVRKLRGTLNPV